jgi:proteic killer suppression protein
MKCLLWLKSDDLCANLYRGGGRRDRRRFRVLGLAAARPERVVEKLAAAALPGWRVHALRGNLAGYWSLSVTGNWRLIARFERGDAMDLDLVDYH